MAEPEQEDAKMPDPAVEEGKQQQKEEGVIIEGPDEEEDSCIPG